MYMCIAVIFTDLFILFFTHSQLLHLPVLGEGSRQANAPHILHIRDSQTVD